MIEPLFHIDMSESELAQVARLLMAFSHTDELLGHSLRAKLRLNGDEGVIMVFPLATETRLQRLVDLCAVAPLDQAGQTALSALVPAMKALQSVRNNIAHSIVIPDEDGNVGFHNRAKQRVFTKTEILSAAELANWAQHMAFAVRCSIGDSNGPWPLRTLPDRPEIPEFLQSHFPKQKAQA